MIVLDIKKLSGADLYQLRLGLGVVVFYDLRCHKQRSLLFHRKLLYDLARRESFAAFDRLLVGKNICEDGFVG